jgi:myo-inositol-1(or 4)-monophosphatase
VHDLLELAISTAGAAGALLIDQRPADLRVAHTKSSPTDVVTEMDQAAEALIIERIRASRPADAGPPPREADRPGETTGQRVTG